MRGKIISDGSKTIYVFGTAKVKGYTTSFNYHVGVDLCTGKVDVIGDISQTEIRLSDLTRDQQMTLADLIPIRLWLERCTVAIAGKARSGKSTLARSLGNTQAVISLGDSVKEVTKIVYGEATKSDREKLILIGQGLRKLDPLIWIKSWLRRAIRSYTSLSNSLIVCDDVRQLDEASFFNSMGAFVVKIEVDQDKRIDVIRKVDGEDAATNTDLLNDETEMSVDSIEADLTFHYNYSTEDVEEFCRLVEEITTEKYIK